MALWRDATAGVTGPGQGDYDPYGDLSALVRQLAPGIGAASQAALQPQFRRPDDTLAAYMADPLARSDADIQQRATAGPPSAPQSLGDLGSLVAPYLAGAAPGGTLSSGIRAYHGSPYDFNAFDASKIGTGEGAQAYGHGMYFAENERVAQGYRDALAAEGATINGTPVRDLAAEKHRMGINETPTDVHHIADYVSSYQDNARYMMQKRQPELLPLYDKMLADGTLKQAGHMYEVDINADPQSLLDWDKPLSEQPAVQQKLATAGVINPRSEFPEVLARANTQTGSQVYESPRLVPGGYRDPQAASAALGQLGIPGIRYLDQGSRGAGQGTSNYVVFDPRIIDILRKYAVPGLITGGAGAGAASAGNP